MMQFSDDYNQTLLNRRRLYDQLTVRGKPKDVFAPPPNVAVDGTPSSALPNGEPVETLPQFANEQIGNRYMDMHTTIPGQHPQTPPGTSPYADIFSTPATAAPKVAPTTDIFGTNAAGAPVGIVPPKSPYNASSLVSSAGASHAGDMSLPRNVRDFNIGNLKTSKRYTWDGAIGSDPGGKVAEGAFVRFKSPEYGVRALTKDLSTKRKRGLNTIGKILPVYAPNGKENDTQAYINSVVKQTGIGANQKLTDADMFKVITAIGRHEGDSGGYYTPEIIQKGMQMAGY